MSKKYKITNENLHKPFYDLEGNVSVFLDSKGKPTENITLDVIMRKTINSMLAIAPGADFFSPELQDSFKSSQDYLDAKATGGDLILNENAFTNLIQGACSLGMSAYYAYQLSGLVEVLEEDKE